MKIPSFQIHKCITAASVLAASSMGDPIPTTKQAVYPVDDYANTGPAYTFQYGVADEYSGSNYAQNESRDPSGTTYGEYRVALPDGRTQVRLLKHLTY